MSGKGIFPPWICIRPSSAQPGKDSLKTMRLRKKFIPNPRRKVRPISSGRTVILSSMAGSREPEWIDGSGRWIFHKCDDCLRFGVSSSHVFQQFLPNPARKRLSYRDFDYSRFIARFWSIDIDRKTSFHGFVQIREQFLERLTLGGTARNRRHLGPKSAFFGLMNDHFYFHLPPKTARCRGRGFSRRGCASGPVRRNGATGGTSCRG